MSMPEENKKAIAISAARELIQLEISTLRKIKKLSSYKELVRESVLHIFKFYDLDELESMSTINFLYDYEEAKEVREEELKKSLGLGINEEYINNSIGYAARALIKLNEYIERRIYYICQSYASKNYPMYSLEDYVFEVLLKFQKEIELPVKKIQAIHNKHTNLEIEYNRQLDILYLSPTSPWFKTSMNDKHKIKNFIKKEKEKMLNPKQAKEKEKRKKELADSFSAKQFERLLNKKKSDEEKKAYELSRHRFQMIKIIEEESVFDSENFSFHSLAGRGFDILFHDSYIYGREQNKYYTQKENISKKITNENILEILDYFEELGITGKLIEVGNNYKIENPTQFKDKDGNINTEKDSFGKTVISDATIQVCKYANWTKECQDLFKEFILIKGLEDIVKYKDNKPIIFL